MTMEGRKIIRKHTLNIGLGHPASKTEVKDTLDLLPPSNSHHQDIRIFLAGNPYEPLFATVTGYVEGIL